MSSFFDQIILQFAQPQGLIALIAIALVSISFYFILPRNDGEQPVSFVVPIPEQTRLGWHGEILDNPSIKARRRVQVSCLQTLILRHRFRDQAQSDVIVQRMENYWAT